MEDKSDVEKHFWEILNEKGDKIHEESRKILLEDIKLEDLREPLKYASENYRDLLRPTLIVLSCEAVGGDTETVFPVATTMTLLGLSLYIFDDIVDRTEYRCFVPTTVGKFGAGKTLIAGGLVTAKAFTLLNQVDLPPMQRRRLSKLFLKFLRGMAEAEIANLRLRKEGKIHAKDKLAVMRMRTVNIEACTKSGAMLGSGSQDEIRHLGELGKHLGLVLELVDDLTESLNFTLELRERMRMGSWPYTLAWAENHSDKIRNLLSLATHKETDPVHIKKIVEGMFESGAVSHVQDLSVRFISMANQELSNLKESEAKRALRLIIEAQFSFLPFTFS